MIIKNLDFQKNIIDKFNLFLFHGNNEGLIKDKIDGILIPNCSRNLHKYDESEILNNTQNFEENIYNQSFFDSDKFIIINKTTDKLIGIVKDINVKKINDVKILLVSKLLEKKSKLRNFFEKNNNLVVTPFYDDSFQSLFFLTQNYFFKKKIKISTENINLIIEKTNGNRLLLKNELEKIFLYSERNKDLTTANIKKLIKNFDNIGISNLTDNFLVKNKKKTLNLLNENTLSLEDNISVIRNCLQQLKKLRILKKELLTTKSIDEVLSKYRPIIFWKDKEVVKQQLKIWSLKDIETSIKKISNIELSIKKNAQVSKQIFNNYILENLS